MNPRVLLYVLEHELLRQVARLLGLPMERGAETSAAEAALVQERLRALVPFVPVAHPLPVWKRSALHALGFWSVLRDIPAYQRRKHERQDEDFSPEIRERTAAFPRYYRKNYHHQTDGYFSIDSAKRYDVQLELVFLGLGQAIREAGASQLRRFLEEDGRYAILECGAGTGELSAILRSLFPRAEILTTDPSVPYLRWAHRKYPELRIRWEPTFMDQLDFCASSSLDVVCSSFVWHELPAAESLRAFAETARVLKRGGYLFLIDSAQDHDGEENRFALDRFTRAFHEPYFPEYRAGSLEQQMRDHGFEIVHRQMLLFSKALIARKGASTR